MTSSLTTEDDLDFAEGVTDVVLFLERGVVEVELLDDSGVFFPEGGVGDDAFDELV